VLVGRNFVAYLSFCMTAWSFFDDVCDCLVVFEFVLDEDAE